MRRFLTAAAAGLVLAAALAGAAAGDARKQTLADIQADLQKVKAQVLGLKQELASTGASSTQPAAGNSVQDRLDAIEAELRSLTDQTEQLQNRINVVVSDGTNRIGDLEYRLVEAQGGDPTKLPKTKPLGGVAPTGGGAAAAGGGAPAAGGAVAAGGATAGGGAAAAGDGTGGGQSGGQSGGPELAVSEQSDFDTAKKAFDGGDYRNAASLFATFAQTYTGGPLTGEALFYRGQALTKVGDVANAARAYLDSFSSYPKGPRAPDALTELGISLGKLGQTQDACTTLGQVGVRYPNAAAVVDAKAAMQGLGCQ